MHLRCMRLGAAGRRHAFPLCPGLDLAYRQGDGSLVCVGVALRHGVLGIGWLIGLVNESAGILRLPGDARDTSWICFHC